jgi:hypothetical protein
VALMGKCIEGTERPVTVEEIRSELNLCLETFILKFESYGLKLCDGYEIEECAITKASHKNLQTME